jgi:hypothetical protein
MISVPAVLGHPCIFCNIQMLEALFSASIKILLALIGLFMRVIAERPPHFAVYPNGCAFTGAALNLVRASVRSRPSFDGARNGRELILCLLQAEKVERATP